MVELVAKLPKEQPGGNPYIIRLADYFRHVDTHTETEIENVQMDILLTLLTLLYGLVINITMFPLPSGGPKEEAWISFLSLVP